jgi:hypothetical protein
MNRIDILNELEKLNDDSEPGFLSELKQQTPNELHSRIMNSIRLEALNSEKPIPTEEIKKRTRFNYRKYASFTAAAALLVVAFVGGAQTLLNNKVTPESISPKSTFSSNAPVNKTNATIKPEALKSNSPKLTNKIVASDTKLAKESLNRKIKDNSTYKKNKINLTNNGQIGQAKVANTDTTKKATKKVVVSAISTEGVDSIVVVQHKKETKTIAALNNKMLTTSDADIKKTPATDNNQSDASTGDKIPSTFDKSVQDKDTSSQETADVTGRASTDTKNPTNLDPFSPESNSMVAYIDGVVNYEISLNMGQIAIKQFVIDKGLKISDAVYRLTKLDFNTLCQRLDQNGITKTKTTNEPNDQYIYVKIINY